MLAESSRLKLLRELMHESMTVSELMEATGMQQGNVSKHLSVLLSGGFVERVQEGNFARYVLYNGTCEARCGTGPLPDADPPVAVENRTSLQSHIVLHETSGQSFMGPLEMPSCGPLHSVSTQSKRISSYSG
jgi:hypothetical protein